MTKGQAISYATERAGKTGRHWYAVTDDAVTWWIEPQYTETVEAVECDRHGPVED